MIEVVKGNGRAVGPVAHGVILSRSRGNAHRSVGQTERVSDFFADEVCKRLAAGACNDVIEDPKAQVGIFITLPGGVTRIPYRRNGLAARRRLAQFVLVEELVVQRRPAV